VHIQLIACESKRAVENFLYCIKSSGGHAAQNVIQRIHPFRGTMESPDNAHGDTCINDPIA